MARTLLIAALLAPLALASGAMAADTSEADQLREQLRATVLQLRALQDQQTVASTPTATVPDADIKKKLATAEANLRLARAKAAKAAQLQADLDKAKSDNAALTATQATTSAELDKYKAAFDQASDQVRALTVARDGLAAKLTRMTAIASVCQTKNDRLTALIEDMLKTNRRAAAGFSHFNEPFLGLARVRLENILQDREDAVRADHCDPRTDATPPRPAAG